jgi:hypothetical protein
MSAPATPGPQQEELSYRIELWHHAEAGGGVELVLARALNAQLGHAIFNAVREEHPNRRITLSKGDRIIADSSK